MMFTSPTKIALVNVKIVDPVPTKITVKELSDEMLDSLYTEVVEELVHRKNARKTLDEKLRIHFLAIEKMMVKFHAVPENVAHKKVEELVKRNEGKVGALCWEPYNTAADLSLPLKQANRFINKNYNKHKIEIANIMANIK